jgi:hypothetical protein
MRPIESNGPALLRMGPPIQLRPCIASREPCRLVFRTLYSHSRTPKKSASEKCLSHGARRSRRCSKGGVMRLCAAKADRRDQQARRATRDRQDPRAIAAKQGHPAHPDQPAPQPQPRCAASTPTAIASPAKKTKSWSPQSAKMPAVRLSSKGQRCAARDQRESSASACASRNSGR